MKKKRERCCKVPLRGLHERRAPEFLFSVIMAQAAFQSDWSGIRRKETRSHPESL
ncbi:hypothetical protein L2649_11940 [Thermoactinomyces vulgaris]|uniref:Uncharacterized protein n=1 Tax=Thermoactinomyces vulgaris TaxID=2026 RepID=A0ABS0QKR9_THEVU|nr:hypothetical protein [Thermoactinomyces vulgaris]MBA4552436.1 hypothetical protein [Thermoactinomyces vulgaris]MBA4596609.1 hypothetical protein [Thermoactinomyces vulgaris]MBH8589359.1 hypothetical protein [Thermoactinomyces vulgaris]MCF6135877.1 hypothetical protein [Thermoactinomyces vulgaris]